MGGSGEGGGGRGGGGGGGGWERPQMTTEVLPHRYTLYVQRLVDTNSSSVSSEIKGINREFVRSLLFQEDCTLDVGTLL